MGGWDETLDVDIDDIEADITSPTRIIGGQKKILISDMSSNELLGRILMKLEIIIMQLQIGTDEEIKEGDIYNGY